jgi:hypothetical protein
MKKFATVLLLLLICLYLNASGKVTQHEWKAGIANTVITPESSLWLAGYGHRDHPSEGTLHDLQVKALAVEDINGSKGVLVTSDILGFPRALSDRIKKELRVRLNLSEAQIILNSSHTHSGPVLPNSLVDIYKLDDRMQKKINAYESELEKKIINTVIKAFENLKPASIYAQNGVTRFQVNRRNNSESKIEFLTGLNGPNDYAVPVLKVVTEADAVLAIVFGYACHPTVLSHYLFSGDYPGFAQIALEEMHPESTALFFQGAGADQNPLPRRSVALAEQYGKTLAVAVDRVLKEDMQKLLPKLQVEYSEIHLPLSEPLSKEELKNMAETKSGYQQNWAKRMLLEEEHGTSYPYPVQIWNLGGLPFVALGGEVTVEYAIETKKILGSKTFVLGYSNDLMAYIPSATVLKEGGYEGADSQMVYGMPALWEKGIDSLIYREIINLAQKAGLNIDENYIKILYNDRQTNFY